ncbi:uncharacterized protein LOC134242534 isoform X2 [Saccostrea cucullata]|uniref:uncharacterized protein LOC134242534 isoform X2 n=1 Tax=Saccostrea cuccullata TaxID=36930 RepID=UPI002ED576F6
MIQSPCYVPTTLIVMFFGKGNPPDTTSIVPTTEKISNQTLTDGGGSENKFETFVEHEIGGIVGLIFGLLFSAALILAAWITYRRHRYKLLFQEQETRNIGEIWRCS